MAIPDPGGQAEGVLPRLLVAAAVTVVLVLRPALVSDLEHSPRAWVVSAGIVLASAIARRVVARRSVPAAPWAAAAVTLGLFAVVAAPAFRERALHEDFPAVAAPVADVIAGTPSADPSDLAPSAPPSATPSPTTVASRRTPSSAPSDPATAPTVLPAASASAVPPPAVTATPTAALLSAGQLDGLGGHQASGRVALYRVGDGTVLRFEDVDISGGAKPSVHLVPPGKHRPEGGIALGPLKAERGSFTYPVPSTVDRTWSVLVWCEPYDVPIGAADLH